MTSPSIIDSIASQPPHQYPERSGKKNLDQRSEFKLYRAES